MIVSVRFESPTEVECFYFSPRENTLLEDISDTLNTQLGSRFELGIISVSLPL